MFAVGVLDNLLTPGVSWLITIFLGSHTFLSRLSVYRDEYEKNLLTVGSLIGPI